MSISTKKDLGKIAGIQHASQHSIDKLKKREKGMKSYRSVADSSSELEIEAEVC